MTRGLEATVLTNEIDVVLTDDGPHPEACVAPAGLVTLRIVNNGSHTHRLVLLRTSDSHDTTMPVEAFPVLDPGGAASVECDLASGEYVLLGEASRNRSAPRVLALTVQPAEGRS